MQDVLEGSCAALHILARDLPTRALLRHSPHIHLFIQLLYSPTEAIQRVAAAIICELTQVRRESPALLFLSDNEIIDDSISAYSRISSILSSSCSFPSEGSGRRRGAGTGRGPSHTAASVGDGALSQRGSCHVRRRHRAAHVRVARRATAGPQHPTQPCGLWCANAAVDTAAAAATAAQRYGHSAGPQCTTSASAPQSGPGRTAAASRTASGESSCRAGRWTGASGCRPLPRPPARRWFDAQLSSAGHAAAGPTGATDTAAAGWAGSGASASYRPSCRASTTALHRLLRLR